MAVYSVNQNRQFYVANKYSATIDDTTVVGNVKEGIIGGVKTIGEGKDKELFFLYKGVDNTLKSDRINLQNLNYAKVFAAADMVEPLKSVTVALDTDVNEGKVVPGQDYILRVNFFEWIGVDPRYQYVKDGCVHATAEMVTAPLKFYQAMVDSLNLCFSRELGSNKTSNPYLKFEASANGITITEKEQGWSLGTVKQERVHFEVQPTTVYVNGEDKIWGTVTDVTPAKYVKDTNSESSTYGQMIPNGGIVIGTNAIGNGKKIADLEWFCMGERGDQYRNVGWPNVIPTKYMVDASKQYNVLELHFAYTDEGVNSYRSEKDITIVAEDATELNKLIGAINAAASLSIATLTV